MRPCTLTFFNFLCFTKLCLNCERLVLYLDSDIFYPFLRTSHRESHKGSHLPHPQKAVGNERAAAAHKKTLPACAVISRWHNGHNRQFRWVRHKLWRFRVWCNVKQEEDVVLMITVHRVRHMVTHSMWLLKSNQFMWSLSGLSWRWQL